MLSITIIVKNEADNLKQCLMKLEHLKYEIIVVDTGSTDGTKEVALQFTDKVFDFEWRDDFSAARNFAIHQASEEFILMVDSDEFLTEINEKELEVLLCQHPGAVGKIHCKSNFMREGDEFAANELVSRIFSKSLYHYEGSIHEQIVSLSGGIYQTYVAPIFMNHGGYMGGRAEREKKAERNIALLKKALGETKNDPYLYYQLGKGYYYKGDYRTAADYFREALYFDLDTKLEYVIDMVEIYGYSLINSEQYAEALLLENVYEEFSDSADFVYMMGLVYLQNAMFDLAVSMFKKAASHQTCKVEGVNSYLAFYNIGVIYECLGDQKKAFTFYEKCDEYPKAREAKTRLLNNK